MQHGDIWRGIDLLARSHGLSTSGLARRAGLDPTAFNKSKRLPKDGRPRWPSTESLSRALQAVGAEFDEFAMLVTGRRGLALPLLRQSDLDAAPAMSGADVTDLSHTDRLRVPGDETSGAWLVLEIDEPSFAPVYEIGDRLILSPGAPVRDGDRIALKPRHRAVQIGVARRVTSAQIDVQMLTRAGEMRTHERSEIDLIARILWASQ